MCQYVIVSSQPWFKNHPKSDDFKEFDFIEIYKKEELTLEYLAKINPRYIFFTHWNWIVPSDIFKAYECVVFHTAPLPYGRGGSPIQNLIVRKHKTAPVCALRMTEVIDGGPIYCSKEVKLQGTIDEIFKEIAVVVEELIIYICRCEPTPKAQIGEPFYFKRLTQVDNEISEHLMLDEIYDRIRMVDGQNYPKAFMKYGSYKIEFSRASLAENELVAQIRIVKNDDSIG